MDNAVAALLAGACLLTLLAIHRRWKRRSAWFLNIAASYLLFCAASFRAYGHSFSALTDTYRIIFSSGRGKAFFAALILTPWLLSHIVGRLLRLIDLEKERERQRRADAGRRAEEERLRQEEAERDELREAIQEINAYQLDIIPFLSAVNAGGQRNQRFESALAGWKRRAQDVKTRCERLNQIAGEMQVSERASVFTR